MLFRNYYWYFEKALSKATCEKIIKFGEAKKLDIASIGNIGLNKKSKKKDKDLVEKSRKSKIRFMNDQWLYDIFAPYINTANKNAGWNYDLSWSESFQFTVYKKNNYYHWHQDTFESPYKSDDPNFNNKTRKVSLICNLTDPKKFKGGEVEFDVTNQRIRKTIILKCKEARQQGTVIVFPSFVWHRVKPVTSGVRKSLVNWSIGDPWR